MDEPSITIDLDGFQRNDLKDFKSYDRTPESEAANLDDRTKIFLMEVSVLCDGMIDSYMFWGLSIFLFYFFMLYFVASFFLLLPHIYWFLYTYVYICLGTWWRE